MIGKKMPVVGGSGRGQVQGAASVDIVRHPHISSQVRPANPPTHHWLQATVDRRPASGQGKGAEL